MVLFLLRQIVYQIYQPYQILLFDIISLLYFYLDFLEWDFQLEYFLIQIHEGVCVKHEYPTYLLHLWQPAFFRHRSFLMVNDYDSTEHHKHVFHHQFPHV